MMRYGIFVAAILLLSCSSFNDKVSTGTPDDIAREIAKGADVNKPGSDGTTPLISAVMYSRTPLEAAKILVDAGASVGGRDGYGRTALHLAAGWRKAPESDDLVVFLLSRGADVNAKDSSGATPLFMAACRKDGETAAKMLLDHGADIRARNVQGNTPLHEAARIKNNEAMIRFLVRSGIPAGADNNGLTPLHCAVSSSLAGNADALLSLGAGISVKGNTSESKTPLEEAVNANSIECVRLLLERGADVNTETYYYFKPFKYRNNTQTAAQKFVHGDASRIDFERMTPLHRAVTHNNGEMVRLILSKKPALNKDAHFGGYALDFAVEMEYADIARDIHAAGGKLLFPEMYLSRFASGNNAAMLDLVCSFGAQIDKKMEPWGNTALHDAAIAGSAESVRVLLKYNARRDVRNNEGKTAFECAKTDEVRSLLAAK